MGKMTAEVADKNQIKDGARPFGLFEWMLARRYISATKNGAGVSLISIIAFVGIMLAVAVLIIVMSVMQGFRAKLLDQLLGVNGHIFVEGIVDRPMTDYALISEELRVVPGVTQAIPIIQAPVAVISGELQEAAAVYGIRPADLRSIKLITGKDSLVSGSFDDFGEGRKGGNKIALGVGLARKLNITSGDILNIITAGGAETPMGTSPVRSKAYEVGAVYAVGNSQIDAFFIYMPLEQAQLFFKKKNQVDKIEVRVERPGEVQLYQPMIEVAAGPNTYTYNWQDVHKSYFQALEIERGMIRIILSLIVAVAALNIITGLVMLVKDKTADIAVLRTIGASQGSIMRIFLLSGSMIGVLATISGVIIGIIVSLNVAGIEVFLSKALGIRLFSPDIYLFDEMPAQVQMSEVLFVSVFALVMSLLTTIYPASRAAKLDPVEALRYE